jgi:predicted nucleotidyltransferase
LSNTAAAEHARSFARGIADYWQEQLGERLLGCYLIGSLAHGGFSAYYSDIDVGLTSTNGLTPIEIEAMRQHARKFSPDLASRLPLCVKLGGA